LSRGDLHQLFSNAIALSNKVFDLQCLHAPFEQAVITLPDRVAVSCGGATIELRWAQWSCQSICSGVTSGYWQVSSLRRTIRQFPC